MANATKKATAKKTTPAKATAPAPAKPTTKLAKLKEHWAAGEYREALKLAAGWQRLGEHKEAIEKGHNAVGHPNIYTQLGEDPAALYAAGLAAVAARYGFPPATDTTPGWARVEPAEPKPTPRKPKAPGVLAKVTRPYLAGQIIGKHGLAAGVTDEMVAELNNAYGKPNDVESMFCLKNAWHACRAYAGVAEDAIA